MAGGLLKAFATAADAPLIGDQKEIDRLFKSTRWRVMLAITLGYGLIYTCRLAIGMVKPSMIDAGIFTPAEFGLIGSALFYTYALGKLTNGFFADHANMRIFLTFGFVMTAICNIGMGFADTVLLAAVIWGINGYFQGFGAPGGVVAMTHWFSNRERGRAYGLWSTAHSVGEGLTFFVTGAVVAYFGWRWGYFVPAMIGFAAAVMMWSLVRDRPRTMGLPTVADWKNDHVAESDTNKSKGRLALQFSVLSYPTIWILGLSSAANYVTRYAINSWGPLYLQEARGFDEVASGTMLMISTLAGIVGSVGYGWISDKWFGARRPPANLIFAICEIIGLLLIFFGPQNTPTLIAGMIFFGLGLAGLVASLGGLFAVDICPKRATGAAMGVIGIFSYLGAALQENISGALLEQHSHMVGTDRVYDFEPAIWFWLGSSVVSMLLAATLWRAKLRDSAQPPPQARTRCVCGAKDRCRARRRTGANARRLRRLHSWRFRRRSELYRTRPEETRQRSACSSGFCLCTPRSEPAHKEQRVEEHDNPVDRRGDCESDVAENGPRVAADVQAHLRTHRVQAVHQPLVPVPNQIPVDPWAGQRRRRIAHADQISARLHLGAGEAQTQLQHEIEEVPHEGRIVVKVQHERVDPAQIGRRATRTLHPALNHLRRPDGPLQLPDRLQAVPHGRRRFRVRTNHPAQLTLLAQPRLRFVDGVGLILEIPDRRAAVARLPRFRDRRDMIEGKTLRRGQLGLHQHVVLQGISAVRHTGLVGGEHHCHRHQREAVHRLPGEQCENTFTAIHGAPHALSTIQQVPA